MADVVSAVYIHLNLLLFRFQKQTRLYKSKPIDFQKALEEALLAEDGILHSDLGVEQITNVESHLGGSVSATGSHDDQEYHCQDQVS